MRTRFQLLGLSLTSPWSHFPTGSVILTIDISSLLFGDKRDFHSASGLVLSPIQLVSLLLSCRSSPERPTELQLIDSSSTLFQSTNCIPRSTSIQRKELTSTISTLREPNGTLRSKSLKNQILWSWPPWCLCSTSNQSRRDLSNYQACTLAHATSIHKELEVSPLTLGNSTSISSAENKEVNSGSREVLLS